MKTSQTKAALTARVYNQNILSILVVITAAFCLSFTSAVAALWTPADITTVGWYDASNSGDVVTSGTNVTSWNDLSGNGYHLDQVSGGSAKYGAGAKINGLDVIHFSGTTNQLFRDGIADISLTQLTVISLGMPKAAGDSPSLGNLYSTDGTDNLRLRLANNNTSGRISSTLGLDGTNTGLSTSATSAIIDDAPVILTAYYDGLNGVARANGGVQSTTVDVADGKTFTLNKIQTGRDSNTPRNYHGEMIILDSADLDTIEKVEGYLAWKWGMEDGLAADHTYKMAAPVPEPSTTALLGLGGLALILRRRR